MHSNKTFFVRNLIPKSYHFDGYNEIKCPNSRDKPFFTDNVIPMGNHNLTIRLVNENTVVLEFSSVCPDGNITFSPFTLTLKDYVEKLKRAIQEGSDFITFEINPKYNCNHNKMKNCSYRNKDCSELNSKRHSCVYAAVSFNSKEVKEALASYFEITKTINGGKSIMKKGKNLFGMNFELGVSKDSNIAATLMGVAVRNRETGNWYTFDKANNALKNLANFKMGNFPVFLLPTKTLAAGDLIKLNGKYYYVKAANTSNTITLIDAATGIIQEMLPEENILLGMTMYTKVVAFDTKTLTDPSSNQGIGGNFLAAICMMHWSKGNEDEFSLDGINDDSYNGLGAYLPLILASNNSAGGIFAGSDGAIDISKMIMLGAMSDNSDNDGMTQMLVISQLLGGGNNPLSSMGITPATVSNDSESVVCEKCGKTYPVGTNFCSVCGEKTKSTIPTCHNCGATLAKDAKFCSKCGSKIGSLACPSCGHEVETDAKFCSECGTKISDIKSPKENDSDNLKAE